MLNIPCNLTLVELLNLLEQLKIQYLILIESISRIEKKNIAGDLNEKLFNHRKEMENLLIQIQNFTDKFKITVAIDDQGQLWKFYQNSDTGKDAIKVNHTKD